MTTARSRWSESNYPSPDMFEGTPSSNSAALAQPAWFIDPVNGSDNNDGATPATALQSLTALAMRWGKGNVLLPPNGTVSLQPTVTVTLLNNNVPSDIPDFDVILGANSFGPTSLVFKGTVLSTTPISGPVTVTDKVRATNTPWQLHTTAPAAGLVTGGPGGNNIRIFDVNIGAYFWGWKVSPLDPNTILVSEPLLFPGIGSLATNANRVTPQNDDNYVIQTFTMTNLGEMRIGGVRQGAGTPRVVFQDLCLGTTPLPTVVSSIVSDGSVDFYYYGSLIVRRIDAVSTVRNMFFVNSQQSIPNAGSDLMNALSNTWTGGVIQNSTMLADANGFFRFDMDLIMNACTMGFLQPTIEFGTCGIFDAIPFGAIPPQGAINCSAPEVQVNVLNDTTGFLWGGGTFGQNPGVGVSVGTGHNFRYSTLQGITPANITLTGALGDFALQGQTSSFAPTPVGVGVTAGVATYLGPFVNSWVNLGTAQPGGFGGTAVNVAANASILPL